MSTIMSKTDHTQSSDIQEENIDAAAERIVLGEIRIGKILQAFKQAVKEKVYALLISANEQNEQDDTQDQGYTETLLNEINPVNTFAHLAMTDGTLLDLEDATV